MTTSKELIEFYTGIGKNSEGLFFSDIISMSDKEMERCHNFIQWLFPTFTKSAYNIDAPLLALDVANELKGDTIFKVRFSSALKRIFNFWGLTYTKQGSDFIITPITKKLPWMEYDNHNLLRMTRIMESCYWLGFEATGRSLFEALLQTVKTHPEFYFIEPTNVYWWYKSISGSKI